MPWIAIRICVLSEQLIWLEPHPKIKVIASYPCFEFWLLLHFGFNRKPFRAVGKCSPGDLVAKSLREKPNMDKYAKGEDINYFAKLLGGHFKGQEL